jgi:hypothetical protein
MNMPVICAKSLFCHFKQNTDEMPEVARMDFFIE